MTDSPLVSIIKSLVKAIICELLVSSNFSRVVKQIPKARSAAGSLWAAFCYSSLYTDTDGEHYSCSVAKVSLAKVVQVSGAA